MAYDRKSLFYSIMTPSNETGQQIVNAIPSATQPIYLRRDRGDVHGV